MTARPIVLNGWEAGGAHARANMRFLRPVRNQPPPRINDCGVLRTHTKGGDWDRMWCESIAPEDGGSADFDAWGEWFKCPWGNPGDLLWGQEVFSSCHSTHLTNHHGIIYRASWDRPGDEYDRPFTGARRWRSATLLGRRLARFHGEILSVQVFRLCDNVGRAGAAMCLGNRFGGEEDKLGQLRRAWDARYAKRTDLAWSSNPWVWEIITQRRSDLNENVPPHWKGR